MLMVHWQFFEKKEKNAEILAAGVLARAG